MMENSGLEAIWIKRPRVLETLLRDLFADLNEPVRQIL